MLMDVVGLVGFHSLVFKRSLDRDALKCRLIFDNNYFLSRWLEPFCLWVQIQSEFVT